MRITRRHREEMEHLWARLEDDGSNIAVLDTYRLLNMIKTKWFATIKECGAIPVRLWEVSFDSGDGLHYSWRLGEERIDHYHHHDPHAVIRLPHGSRFIHRKSLAAPRQRGR